MTENQEENKFEPKPLTRDQVDYAYELIDEIHPIEKYPIYDAFPYLKWISSRCCHGIPYCVPYSADGGESNAVDEEEKAGLIGADGGRKTFTVNGKEYKKRSKKAKKKQLSDKATQAEPLAQLGFGIVAYTGMLYYMIWAFLLYTIMLIPVFMFYESGTAYDNLENLGYAPRTLGALGYSSYQCQSIPLDIKKITIYCDFGVIGKTDDIYYGVNPEDAHGSCKDNDNNMQCAPTNPTFADAFEGSEGQQYWEINFSDPSDLWGTDTVDPECYSDYAYFYAQFTCVQTEETLHDKYNQMAATVAICILIAYLFTISLRHLYQGGKIKQMEWDMSTITAGDYTVEFKINPDNYRTWYNGEYRKPRGDFENGVSPALSLKRHITEVCEEEMTQEMQRSPLSTSAGNANAGADMKRRKTVRTEQVQRIHVADIVFSFRNAKLISALRTRGKFIAQQKFDKMREQDAVVNELFQDFDALTVPTSAFITFEEEDGKLLAMKTSSKKLLLSQPLKFINASEPTDIIWENRHFTNWDYIKRQTFAFIIIGILLFGSFIVVYLTASYSAKIANTYPTVNCDAIENDYGDSLEKYAGYDYDYIQDNPGQKSSGTLQCFCQSVCDDDRKTCRETSYGDNNEEICKFYTNQVTLNFVLINGLSYALTIINYILRTVCIMMIDWVGFPTETERLSKTTTVTFLVQFFNTAFLLLLVGANFSEQPITFWLTGGEFTDFNSTWFRSIGNTLIGTMWFNAWFPILESLMYYGLRLLFRILDRGCSCDRYKTGKTSIQAYLDTYTGPVYLMHYKYSTLLNVVFVTFMYGLGMPILFPIACLSCVILYFQEKLMLYYGYRVPPMYDERLSQNVLDRLQTAPILFLIFGYWMAGSQQLLSNDYLLPRASTEDVELTDHTIGVFIDIRGWQGYLWTMLVAFVALFSLKCCGGWLVKKFESWFPTLAIGDIELDEDIDNYWASLDDEDRKWSQREEDNSRTALNMPLLTENQNRALQQTPKTAGKTLQGVHSYDILANPLYLDDFQYVTAAEDDRNDMIIDDDDDESNDAAQSDFVRVALNLAFLTEKEARQFKFDKRQMTELKRAGTLASKGNIAASNDVDGNNADGPQLLH